MFCGIYKIICFRNRKFYIGSAKDIEYRWRKHKGLLRRNCHFNKYLQNSWNKHGEKAFVWEIVEVTGIDELISREQHWLDATKCYLPKIGFNTCRFAASSLGRPPSARCMEVISKDWFVISPSGQEFKVKNLARFCRDNCLNRETLKAVGAGRGNSWKGWSCRSASLTVGEWQKLRSDYQTKNGKVKQWIVTDPNGTSKLIVNLRHFCKENRLNPVGMRRVALGKYLQHKGWRCEYA